ncbi:hypothetical protein SBV1_450037 [Verrucomicrobia bacterium]|nr:hypothetical protein SBV1_450037 [Verrucomicrobiota bacterium]
MNLSNRSPSLRQMGSWPFMALYQGRFPRAGRWLKQQRVSGSWRRVAYFAPIIPPCALHASQKLSVE